ARRWKIFWSYLPDWCLTIFLWVDGYRRVFSVTDTSLAHPFSDPERIKVWQLAIYAGVIPAIIIILTGALIRRSIWDVHSGILGLVLNLGLTVTFTDILKITAGRPRPDLYARCQLPADLTENPVHGLVSWTVCTRTDLLQDGFRSFPSGHSSFAWAGMWYLILYAAAKMRISNRRGYTWKAWILLPPLSCAALVSISRTMDYRHHSTDVIAGAIIGILAAWFAYRQFYPPLSHPQAYKPYSPRIPKDEEIPLHSFNGRPSVE
ncbi:phosphatidic acid phosphatase type 2/haloperoxidase, partial [Papiliotrema laurentii]